MPSIPSRGLSSHGPTLLRLALGTMWITHALSMKLRDTCRRRCGPKAS